MYVSPSLDFVLRYFWMLTPLLFVIFVCMYFQQLGLYLLWIYFLSMKYVSQFQNQYMVQQDHSQLNNDFQHLSCLEGSYSITRVMECMSDGQLHSPNSLQFLHYIDSYCLMRFCLNITFNEKTGGYPESVQSRIFRSPPTSYFKKKNQNKVCVIFRVFLFYFRSGQVMLYWVQGIPAGLGPHLFNDTKKPIPI